jgi:hypothetical protein
MVYCKDGCLEKRNPFGLQSLLHDCKDGRVGSHDVQTLRSVLAGAVVFKSGACESQDRFIFQHLRFYCKDGRLERRNPFDFESLLRDCKDGRVKASSFKAIFDFDGKK